MSTIDSPDDYSHAFPSHSSDIYSEGTSHADGRTSVASSSVELFHIESSCLSHDGSPGNADVRQLARNIFTAEVRDVIVVLRNCGALRTRSEYFWCVKELWRLLTKPSPGELV